MGDILDIQNKYLKQIFKNIQDGVLIMNENREILLMNPSARRLTGWNEGGFVPYCSYCETREVKPCENRCYLISNDEVPYFLSKMPTYHGKKINVEMSTAVVYRDEASGQREYLLVLRDQTLKQKEEEARISKMIIKKLIDTQEAEHKRLAQELHDGVGQSLYTISLALQSIEGHVREDKLLNYLHEVMNELERVMKDVKSYSYELRPQSLDQLGLVPTIQSLIVLYEDKLKHVDFNFHTNVSRRFHSLIELNLYRVIQEALHNILKYSRASRVDILLEQRENELFLKIKDNGVGFNREKVKEGLGLKHMEERIDQLNGSFCLKSEPMSGTEIEIIISYIGGIFDD